MDSRTFLSPVILMAVALASTPPVRADEQATLGHEQATLGHEQATPADETPSLVTESIFDLWYGRPGGQDPYAFAAMDDEQRAAMIEESNREAAEHWSVQGDELVNDGEGPFLVTRATYGDYELNLQYKTVPKADSGIYLKDCPQVQIWDFNDPGKFSLNADRGSGGLWNQPAGAAGKDPFVLADRPLGQWNDVRVVQVGSRTSVWLNDHRVVDHVIMDNYWRRGEPLPAAGSVVLQTHGGEIRWRNITIGELDADAANAVLAEHRSVNFQPIFDGMTLDGWIGAVDDYEVTDGGTIQCRQGRGGNLLTAAEYENFSVRLQFKLPPAGNNGLAIRAPATGNPAYQAMCELQVLDHDHPAYKSIDPRQAHGSAYGMVGARRGFLRPTGQWNFQQVDVDGTRVRVELNGNVILDADLADVTEFMADSEHPGLKRSSGHFGFAGHSDPVEFRAISLRVLPSEDEKSAK